MLAVIGGWPAWRCWWGGFLGDKHGNSCLGQSS